MLETILRQKSNLPWASRWNGTVRLEGNSHAIGRHGGKDWSCSISYARDTWDDVKLRYQVGIHESLHGFSAGLTPVAYALYDSFEEGVVEQIWRITRVEVLAALGENRDDFDYSQDDADSPYTVYAEHMEAERKKAGKQKRTFYFTLLNTPLDQREDLIEQWIQETRIRQMNRANRP